MDRERNNSLEVKVHPLPRIAVATSDGIVVNQHFGRAFLFYIYQVDKEGAAHCQEIRTLEPVCEGGEHNDAKLVDSAKKLSDCNYVLVSRIGPGAAQVLEQHGVIPMELPGWITDSLQKCLAYREIQNMLKGCF